MLLFLPLCSAWCFVLNGYGYSFIWCWVETEICHCSTCPSWWRKSNSIDQTSLAEKQSSQISVFVRKHGVLWGRFGFKEISNNGIQSGGCLLLLFQWCLLFPWCPAICPALWGAPWAPLAWPHYCQWQQHSQTFSEFWAQDMSNQHRSQRMFSPIKEAT